MTDDPNLSERLRVLDADQRPAVKRKASPAKVVAALLLSVVPAGAIYYALTQGSGPAPLETQSASEFQTGGNAFGDLDNPTGQPRPRVERTTVQVVQPPAATAPAAAEPAEPDPVTAELMSKLDAMQAELAELRQRPEEGDAQDETAAALDALRQQLDDVTEAAEAAQEGADRRAAELERSIEERDRQIASLQGDLTLAQLAPASALPAPEIQIDPGRDEFELRRQEAEEAAAARRDSPMIAIGGSGGGAGADYQTEAQEAAKLDPNEEFVRNAGKPVAVERAQIIVNPSNTVTQGTIIQAALETALDSTLPGPIRAVVTEDVHSYDGARRLIPKGSKLIGKYSAGVELGQNRVLVAWERIILPDNQTVAISAYGGDEMGRSGTSGKVNSRFAQRFGSAALISLVSALPGLAVDDMDDENAKDATEDLGDDLESATNGIMADYLRIPPNIQVAQGARITVMVDRDLEIF